MNCKLLRGALAAALVTIASAACAQAQKVVLYSSNNVGAIETATDAVKRGNPNLDIQLVTGPTGTLMRRIQAEAQNPNGDVFWTGGFGTLGAYKDYFAPYKPKEADKVAAQFHGPGGLWIGTHVNVMVIMVNERRLRGLPAPKTWSDLMDPQWKGKFALTDPAKSSVAYAIVYGLYKKLGKEGLAKLANNAVITGTSATTYKGVAAGEYVAGFTLEYAAQEYVNGGQKEIKLVYPSEGAILSPEGMAIIKGAKNLDAAKALYDQLFSKAAQEELLTKRLYRPLRSDIQVSALAGLPELKDIKTIEFDQEQAAKDYESIISLWNEIVKQ